MKKIYAFYKRHESIIVTFVLTILSVCVFFYFFKSDKVLLYGDANSRLNIARGVVDSLTPGLGQLSNVWLPFPTFTMLPFIWNNYLWYSGIAGAIGSMIAFVVGGLYLYKSAKILSGSIVASWGATIMYASNINILYLQTTAMSEAIFISTVIFAIYHFLVWIKDNNKVLNLIFAGVAITLASLTRYEGWAMLFSSIPMVGVYVWIKTRSYRIAEGRIILYTTIASFGFILWAIYLTVLYGNPLYWKSVYLSTSGSASASYVFNLTIWQAVWKYFTTVVWMNGVIPTALGIIAIPFAVFRFIKDRSFYFLPLLLTLSLYAFMVLTLQRNTPIIQPELTLSNILSVKTQSLDAFNIRYGLLMLPLIALLFVYLCMIKNIIIRLVLIALLFVQVYSYVNPLYTIIYQIPTGKNIDMLNVDPVKGSDMVQWLKKHYDGGLILISAQVHNPDMLELGFNFRTYINEGSGNYWKESIKQPQAYVTWIIIGPEKEDQVTKFLAGNPQLHMYYDLVFEKGGTKVYKIKTSHSSY